MGPKVVACNMRSSDVKVMPQKENTGGGGDITVDSELSLSSENPVQNKVITDALNDKPDTFVVNFTYNDQTSKYTSDKSYDEVISAINSGKTVFAFDLFSNELKIPLQVGLHTYPSQSLTFYTFLPHYVTNSYDIDTVKMDIYTLDSTNQNDVAFFETTIWRGA